MVNKFFCLLPSQLCYIKIVWNNNDTFEFFNNLVTFSVVDVVYSKRTNSHRVKIAETGDVVDDDDYDDDDDNIPI